MPFEYLKADFERFWIYIVVAIIWGFSAWIEAKRKERAKNPQGQRPRQRETPSHPPSTPIPPPPARPEPILIQTPQGPVQIVFDSEREADDELDSEHRGTAGEHTMNEIEAPPHLINDHGRLEQLSVPTPKRPLVPQKGEPFHLPLLPMDLKDAFLAAEIYGPPRALKGLHRER